MPSMEDLAKGSGENFQEKNQFAKKRFGDRYLWKPTPEIEAAIQRLIFG